MGELVKYIAEALVDHPEHITVTETQQDNQITIELKVADSDMGKVIGKQGKIAKAIRTVVKAAATGTDNYVSVEIVNNGETEA